MLGEAIKNQKFNTIGTFDFPSVSCKPLGDAYLSDSAYPDLFLRSDRWSNLYHVEQSKVVEDSPASFY